MSERTNSTTGPSIECISLYINNRYKKVLHDPKPNEICNKIQARSSDIWKLPKQQHSYGKSEFHVEGPSINLHDFMYMTIVQSNPAGNPDFYAY